MKSLVLTFTVFLLFVFVSCEVETETSQNASQAAKDFVAKYVNGEYESIYDDGSIEMKSYVDKDIFLNILNTQEKIYGKLGEAELKEESVGDYRGSSTIIYNFQLKNEQNEAYSLNAEFLNGHLLRNHIEAPQWANESAFTKSLVSPIADLVMAKDYERIYELLDKKYPLDQIESLIQKIVAECEGVPSRYESCWIDNDKEGKMIIAFEYGYEGKGYLDYRFRIAEDGYPFGGIFFQPDAATKLP